MYMYECDLRSIHHFKVTYLSIYLSIYLFIYLSIYVYTTAAYECQKSSVNQYLFKSRIKTLYPSAMWWSSLLWNGNFITKNQEYCIVDKNNWALSFLARGVCVCVCVCVWTRSGRMQGLYIQNYPLLTFSFDLNFARTRLLSVDEPVSLMKFSIAWELLTKDHVVVNQIAKHRWASLQYNNK